MTGPVPEYVSVVVPLLNEEACIGRLARSLLNQDYPRDGYEIIVADGGSTDRTLEILREIDPDGRIRVLKNPARTAAAGLNVLVAAARGAIVTRVDGHSHVAPNYLRQIMRVMKETGEAVVGGPVRMAADTPFRRALAQALYSRIGVGRVPYRTLRRRSFVESLQTGSFRREVLERIGPFDETLLVVEDLEANTRVRNAGYRLLLDPSIRFWYVPRANLRQVWRQQYAIGRFKVPVLMKHPRIFRLKYVLPAAFVSGAALSCVALGIAAFGGPPQPAVVGAVLLAVYGSVVLGLAISRVPQLGLGACRLLAIVPTLHISYGTGFLSGLFALLRSAPLAERRTPAGRRSATN